MDGAGGAGGGVEGGGERPLCTDCGYVHRVKIQTLHGISRTEKLQEMHHAFPARVGLGRG